MTIVKKIYMENKLIQIPEYAKLKIYWDDKPENYSREAKLRVRNYFAKKYGVEKNNINVVYRPVKIGKNGEVIEITGAGVDNIMDRNYQVSLMKEWCKREGKDVDFTRLLALDTKVNGSLDADTDTLNHRAWKLKWLYLDNFLSFGDSNFVSLGNLNGLNIINSEPSNQGGKTTFSVDAIKYLLYGKTTKTEKNEQIFNIFRDKDTLEVRGLLEIEGKEVIVERKLKRTSKKSGGWNVTHKLNYYTILPDGEEKQLDEADAKQTTELIKQTIGSEKDFDITILATSRTLEDLIDAKATESGRLLTKFIGLEVIEKKEVIAKDMLKEFNKDKKGNIYSIVTLVEDNASQLLAINSHNEDLVNNKFKLGEVKGKLDKLETKRDNFLSSKLIVDVTISELNPEGLELEIKNITKTGVSYKGKIEDLNLDINSMSKITYDEDLYYKLTKESNRLTISIGDYNNKIKAIGTLIGNLETGEVCQACNRALDNVDNSAKIAIEKSSILLCESTSEKLLLELSEAKAKLDNMQSDKELVEKRNRLELEKDKLEVEIGALRNQIIAKKLDLDKYKANESAIKRNIDIDADISAVKTDIIVENRVKDELTRKIYTTETAIDKSNDIIKFNKEMMVTLEGEEAVAKIFKVYLEIIGKKGISKLVLRSVLPIINSELQRLLDDVCDFEVELVMTDKNEVEYIKIKNGVENLLKSGSGLELTISSIALRCVLGKLSHLPMPNFITFDEVLGRVAANNIELVKPMFEKIKSMFDIVFFITHNDSVKDWGDRLITIKKVNNISSINVK